MTAFRLEQAVCTGRGFDAAGFMGKFKAWVVKAYASGGPAWFITDDQSAASPDPYIVISDQNAAGANTPAKYIQILLPSATSGRIYVYYWIYWNPTTHVGFGLWGAHHLPTLDATDFIYDFRGGPQCMFIQSFTTTVWDASWIDEITLDSNLIDSVSATTAVANFSGADLQFRGIDLVGGTMANGLDANGNMYVSIILVSGTTFRVDIFNNAARGGGDLVWRSNNFTGLVAAANTGTQTGSAQNSSGLTYNVYLQGPTAADATIVFRQNKITVGSGEGAQFTVGNYYFIYDFTARNAVNSFQVISKSTDVLTVSALYRPFPVGAKVGSYPHPFFCGGSGNALWVHLSGIPYYNVPGSMSNFVTLATASTCEQSSITPATPVSTYWAGFPNYGPAAAISTDVEYITTMSPDRKGKWAVQRPGVIEYRPYTLSSSGGSRYGNTAYGQLKNVIVGAASTMSPNIHGRKLNGIDYTYFRNMGSYSTNASGGWAAMLRETESNT